MSALRLRPPAVLLTLLSLALGPALGCKRDATSNPSDSSASASEDQVDGLTRDLLLALRQHDDERLAELASEELAASLDEAARVELGTTLDWLGAIEKLDTIDQHEVAGGVERHYGIRFEHGKVELRVTTAGERVHGLVFDEAVWAYLVERAVDAAAGSLRVAEFSLITADGQPLAGPPDPKAIHYAIALEGLSSNLREHEVSIHKVVVDAKGAQVYKEREDEQLRFPEAEIGASGGRITGSVAVPGKGSYELELEITDRIAGDTIVHRHAFAIE